MRDYGKVYTSFWTSDGIRSMSEDARNLALYLLTCPHNTIAGAFRLPDGYVCDDLQWPSKRVAQGFAELLSKGFANRCETTKWCWICKHLEWNPPENPNQRKSAAKIAASIPDACSWKPAFMRDCAESIGMTYEPLPNPSPTLSQPGTGTGTGTEEKEQKHVAEKPATVAHPGFSEFWIAYPRKEAKREAEKAWNSVKPDLVAALAALAEQKKSRQWREGVVPHGATWLRGRRWEDEPAQPPANCSSASADRAARYGGVDPFAGAI